MEGVGIITLALLLAFYFIPTIVGYANHQPNLQSIATVNIFLGWTVIGWVAALAWAFAAQEKAVIAPATVALAEVRDAAVKRAGGLGKAAGSSNDGTSHDASWWDAFVDDYNDTLVAVSADGAREEVARIVVSDPSVQPAASAAGFDMLDYQDPHVVAWASEHAAEMLTKDGTGGDLADSTRSMIRQLITNALDDKATRSQISTRLQEAYAFSKQRAELIAQTEVRNAQGMGGLQGALAVGMKVKKWLLSNDEGVCPLCEANAEQGWIAVDKPFISGALAPLQHPNCRCDAAYRRKPIEG